MSSYQYRKSHCGDKTMSWPSYFHNGISYTDKMTSLYWIRAQIYSINTTIQTIQRTTKPGVYFMLRGLHQGYIIGQCISRCIFHDRGLYRYILCQCIFRCIFHDRELYQGYILCQCIFRCIFHDQGVVPRIYTLSMYIQMYISWSGVFSCDQAALWMVFSVRLSVCPSVCPSVTPFWLCSHHRIIMKFSGVITLDQGKVHAKGQGQRSKVKVTEVTTQLFVSGL